MTTENLNDTEINLRLAEALDVDLTAQTATLNIHKMAYRRTPPNWAGSIELAFELGGEMLHRQHDIEYGRHLADEAKRVSDDSSHEFRIAHLGPRQRALAALRTLEEAKSQ